MTLPPKYYDSAIPLVFDCSAALCFIVIMRNTVSQSRIKNVAPGARYTFVFRQKGNYAFTWPDVCHNASPVCEEPNSTTVQTFVGNTGGYLEAVAVAAVEQV
jgi:hypothetical protein